MNWRIRKKMPCVRSPALAGPPEKCPNYGRAGKRPDQGKHMLLIRLLVLVERILGKAALFGCKAQAGQSTIKKSGHTFAIPYPSAYS
jgi:hypothetical protein